MVKPLTILCVHGVGHAELDPMFRDRWNDAILAGVRALRPDQPVTLEFFQYDTLFEHAPLNPGVYEKAFTRLLASAAVHGIIDLLTARRALADLPAAIRWTAGMVAQWSAEDDLRAAARARLLAQLAGRTYDLVCAHSLGSLIAYDTFARQPDAIAGTVLATLGSQIGHPAVRDVFAGRISGLRRASHWYHLFNPHDHVLTRPLSVPDGNFSQLTTTFDLPNDILNHDAAAYLRHANTIAGLWRPLLG
ncbi:MAG TPA: hypothetical protein VNH46_01600, partial [Gemmatimonadales bacterium]|nr:hypothetical protein [Gemmatimonadales bacterium]